jgi:hypothetical protein
VLTYVNSYLGLSIEIPSDWKVVSRKHSKLDPSRHREYQFRDDDLPREVDRCKVLFNASLYTPGSDINLDAEIELSIYYLSANDNLRTSLVENLRRLIPYYESYGITNAITGEGRWVIDGVDFGYVDEESTSRNGHHRYRFLYRHIEGGLWFYGKIAGHKDWAFADSIKIVEGLRCDGTRGA